MDNCVFCKIIRREIPAYIIDENEHVIVLLAPENHPLVITKNHIRDIYALDDVSAAAVMKAAVKIATATKTGLNCDGINLVQSNEPAGQQDVFHFHLHIKPRWHEDHVTLHWETDTVDEEIRKQTFDKIRQSLR